MDRLPGNLLYGICIGLIIALIIGTLSNRFLVFRRRWRARYSPMSSFPDSVQSSLTPIRVVRSSCLSGIFMIFIIIIAIAIVYFVINYHDDIIDMILIFSPS